MAAASSDRSGVVVIGGANIDVRARGSARVELHTSNPGTASWSAGGVGRNVAENLARLGTPVQLVTAVGRDTRGDRLLDETATAGVGVEHVVRSAQPTGSYTAVLDADGELLVAVSDMAAVDQLAPDDVRRVAPLVASAALLVLDGNLSPASLAAGLDVAADGGTPVVLDPVSVPKARRLAPLLGAAHPLLAVTPNLGELAALTDRRVDGPGEVATAAAHLHREGVHHVWVRLGAQGSILSTAGKTVRLDPVGGPVADVTGAGDAMLAAFCHRLLAGASPEKAARFGHAAAALTIAVPQTVRPDLSVALVERLSSERPEVPT